MITTIKEIIKNQGWKQGQMVETDIWFGVQFARHIKRVMLIVGTELYFESDKLFHMESPQSGVFEEKESGCLHMDPKNEVVYACTYAEAKRDAVMLTEIIKEKRNNEIKILTEKISEHVRAINELLTDSDRSVISEIGEQFDEFNGYGRFKDLVEYAGYSLEPGEEYEDIAYEISRIHFRNSFRIGGTVVSLSNAVSVETDCVRGGKECVCVNTADGEEYIVYKDKQNDTYCALKTLFIAI